MRPRLVLYHYTSGSGLMGIFDSGAIWASSIHQLNDSKELRHALELAKGEIARVVSETPEPNAAVLGTRIADLIDKCNELSVYVASFSEDGDSVNQWRSYCPEGFGYNIGFDGDLLRTSAARHGFTLGPCTYIDSKKRALIRAWAQSTMAGLLPGFDPSLPTMTTEDVAWPYVQSLLKVAPFFKHDSFHEEREWRIAKVVESDSPALKVRAGKTMLIRYLPVELQLSLASDLVWNVCVGPTQYPELAMQSVGHYFYKLRIRSGVQRSRCPFRPL